ncbi:uncharacterized protein LODBEIA_P41660 [Lodderomyces beijingensis]|uniref:Uncharacterized protein n=1 Tax=Lodderomyces beijingensis TaxID=1775926 RepID=A0ABP0ZP91_9ASCO
MSQLDNEASRSWHKLYKSYAESNNLASDPHVEAEYQAVANTPSDHASEVREMDLADEIPLLSELIESTPNCEELKSELKSLLAKYYWAGYELRGNLT